MTYAITELDPTTTLPVSQNRKGKFRNRKLVQNPGFWKTLDIMWRFAFRKPANTVPHQPIPLQLLTQNELLAAPDRALFRLGHSTMLMKFDESFWLTDPVFSERASPFQWMGPKRFHQPPISIEELPSIKGVILSHDHYDHLDYHAILQLNHKVEYFITPLGVGDRLIEWGVAPHKIHQLDWWQSTTVDNLHLVATPAQHFSGRGIGDRNHTLWCSWVMVHGNFKLFFSGDSGYFDGFKAIGHRYGSFDVAMIETGAYAQQWPDVHMHPSETMQAFLDLQAQYLLPVHNGTFDLSLHAWDDPFERIVELGEQHEVTVCTPIMGELFDLNAPHEGRRWWRE